MQSNNQSFATDSPYVTLSMYMQRLHNITYKVCPFCYHPYFILLGYYALHDVYLCCDCGWKLKIILLLLYLIRCNRVRVLCNQLYDKKTVQI